MPKFFINYITNFKYENFIDNLTRSKLLASMRAGLHIRILYNGSND